MYRCPAQGYAALSGQSQIWPALWCLSPTAWLLAAGRPAGPTARTSCRQPHSGGTSYQLCPAPSPGHTLRTALHGSDSWLEGSEDGGTRQKRPTLCWVAQAAQSCPSCGARALEPGFGGGTLVSPEGVRQRFVVAAACSGVMSCWDPSVQRFCGRKLGRTRMLHAAGAAMGAGPSSLWSSAVCSPPGSWERLWSHIVVSVAGEGR